ncbi:MAG: HAD-IA family hydrolase [Lachnospiraceae bacterium]|nr:HAD-IA family hydrolase [Lachnospiraceae bacterium]
MAIQNITQKIYQPLVNKHTGIAYRYHKFHDGTTGIRKVVSWFYLLWLNFAYYVLFCHFLGRKPETEAYESKRLNIKMSESEAYLKANPRLSVTAYVDKLKEYDVISFDVFDTLIFRPFSVPTDSFFLVGESFDIMDFKNIRTWAEWDAREKCKKQNGHMEIDLKEIWKNLEKETGLSAEEGMEIEQKTEQKLCYANPFMLEVWKRLQSMNKKLIIISDMYLPEDCIAKILENAGFTGIEKIYVSNTYHKSKADGSLYREVIKDYSGLSIAHVGDNPHSDDKMAENCGIYALPYQNINKNVLLYRPMDMSAIVGSAYRAIVSSHLYNGLHSYGMEYEYGFIYGGLFVVGYCNFIHEYYNHHGLDKLLFLSRDGDILKQVYDFLYPEDSTEYVYWSRKVAVKLMANEDKHDFFRRFLYHKVNQKYTIARILHSMELDSLTEQLDIKSDEELMKPDKKLIKSDEELTDKNVRQLKQFIESKWGQVLTIYEPQMTAARKYYKHVLDGCSKVAAVDIGWAGSGAMSLSHLTEKVWKIPCQVNGIIAGTNTIHNAEPDASEIFLQNGKLTAYLYSQSQNRDLLKKHDPNKDYNVFWELLLSSPTPQFAGFYEGKTDEVSSQYLEELDITLAFGQMDMKDLEKEDTEKENVEKERIQKIQEGILAFAHEYHRHFKDFPYMFRISGRDAYAPMLVAASHSERYLKALEKRFHFEKNII